MTAAQVRAMLADREFQLEEREDQDSAVTDIWLNGNGSVNLGPTDGPLPKSYTGSWSILETAAREDHPFRLLLDRTYEAKNNVAVEYHVKREFWGNVGQVGDVQEIEGIIHGMDERNNIDCEVFFFCSNWLVFFFFDWISKAIKTWNAKTERKE